MNFYHGPLILTKEKDLIWSQGLRQSRQFVNKNTLTTIHNSLIQPSHLLIFVIWYGITYLKVWQQDYKNCRIGLVDDVSSKYVLY